MTRNRFVRRVSWTIVALQTGLALMATAAPAEPPQALLTLANPNVRAIIAVQNAKTPALMATPDVLGTAVGLDGQGDLALVVFVNSEGKNPGAAAQSSLAKLRGVVRATVEMTEPFRALAGKPGGSGGVSHKAIQTPPIQLGTSGSWRYDLANGFCCGGTLGSLIQINGEQYILSNYHIFDSDIVSGGNSRVAQAGDSVIQPGLIDVGCIASSAQNVATLSGIKSLSGNNVDAGIAKVVPGMVRTDGAILEIGTISAQTVVASFNQRVKKSGRTTGLTRSSVAGLNATLSVTYENECAGGTAFTKTFTGQILINNRLSGGRKFIDGGDSGSLMVEDVTTSPKAVGLLYAGSNTYAIANPIGDVLDFFGAQMVGQ
jgi:hypothetical protein